MVKKENKENKFNFWKQWLGEEDLPFELSENSFFEECKMWEEVLLLNDREFEDYYITHYDHREIISFVIKLRYKKIVKLIKL